MSCCLFLRPLSSPTSLCTAVVSRSSRASPRIRRRQLQTLRLEPLQGSAGRTSADANPNLFLRNKFHFKDIDAARQLLIAWGVDKMPAVTFIDVFAGDGLLTKAALQLPNVAKVITMIPEPPSDSQAQNPKRKTKYLVEKVFSGLDDPRLLALPESGYHWHTWEGLKAVGALDNIKSAPWTEENRNLFVAFQLGDNIHSEKLAFQIMQASFSKLWLYTYGRIPVGFITSKAFYERTTASPGDSRRHKTAVLVESMCTLDSTPSSGIAGRDNRKKPLHNEPASFRMLPLANPGCPDQLHYDALEFLSRQLFMHISKPIKESLTFLAPNAPVILDIAAQRRRPVNGGKLPGELSHSEWMRLVQAFLAWPFRPKDLLTPLLRLGSDDDDE